MMIFEEDETGRQNKQATALKKAGDMAGAVAALRRVKTLEGEQYQETRLAKFLQQAGQMDAALVEIQWLLDHSQAQAKALFGHQPASVIQSQHASWCARVHADAALMCKRAKLPELQAKHEQLQERYASIHDRLKPLADADQKAKRAGWEEAMQQGPSAMRAYHDKHPQVVK